MNMEGKTLAKRASWTKLITEATFTTVAAAAQTSSVPSDFGWYINETMWNRNTDRPVRGPISPEKWHAIQAIGLVSLPDAHFRFRGQGTSAILMTPTPTAGHTVAYEYVSKNWCETAGGTDQAAFDGDTNVGILDEELITLGVIWRFLKAGGFDYAEEFRTYEIEVNKAIARDGGKPRLQLEGGVRENIYNANIPESGWSLS
jgi:hypothetical protein